MAATATAAIMGVTVQRERLAAALQLCNSVVEKRATMPILQNVKLEAVGDRASSDRLRITATDLELTVVTTIPADVARLGSVTVEAVALHEAIKSSSSENVTIASADNAQITITCGSAVFTLLGLPADMFPSEPDLSGDAIEFPAAELQTLLRATIYAQDGTETRMQLGGVLLKPLKKRYDLAASNGHRLALAAGDGIVGTADPVFLPAKLVRTIEKLTGETLALTIGDGHIAITADNGTVICRKVDVNFPNYRGVLPKSEHFAVVDRAEALAMVRRIGFFTSERTKAIRFVLAANRLTCEGFSPDKGTRSVDYMPLEYSGPAVQIGLSSQYVAQAINAIRTDKVRIGFTDGNTAIEFIPDPAPEVEEIHLVMPMTLQW